MQAPLYPLLTNTILLTQTVAHHTNIHAALSGAGYTDSVHSAGQNLITRTHNAILLIHATLQTDKSALHLIHSSATELEMWIQTAQYRVRKASQNEEQVAIATGSHLHGPDHTLTIMAQAQRFLSLVRTDETLRHALGSDRSVQDLLQRGYALQSKLWRCAKDAANPKNTDASNTTSNLAHELHTWLHGAHQAAERAFLDQARLLGLLGHTPDHLATPLGGTSHNVTRHQHTQHQPPTGGPSPDAPGWSAGRQGRNNLNHGKGYTPRA